MRGLPVTGRSAVELGVINRTPAVLYEDFICFGQTDLSITATAGRWIVGGLNSAIASIDQMDVVVADGEVTGAIEVTTTTGSGDECFMQLEGAPFICALGRKMVFSTRVRLDTITTANQYFGMWIPGAVATGSVDPEDTQVSGFGFAVVAGVVNYQVKNATTTLANTAAGLTLTASTTTGWHKFEIYWDGVNTLEFWVDGTRYVSYTGAAIPLNLYLAPAIGISTGSGAAKAMKCDWIYAATEAPVAGR